MMESEAGHKIEPRRQGRFVTCKVCGRLVQQVRHGVRRSFWRHTSGTALMNLWWANTKRRMDAGNY